ncbi:aminopeptidase O-like isoform X2 [Babylonia areolata]|uniref:aminopeptidase O-like isoform X2 n=1 Tax=Babylonia areolata TaxID=304850 RepID=UPI003FD3FC58
MAVEKSEVSSNDLPLSANLQDITVKHFVLDLSCNLAQNIFKGSITLWCLPSQAKTAIETQEATRKNSAVLCATDDGRADQLSSPASFEISGLSCPIARVRSDEDDSNYSSVYSGQSCCTDRDRHCSVTCVQSSPSFRDKDEMVIKTAIDTETGEVWKCVESITDHASLDRECSCVCVPCERCTGECCTVHTAVGLDASKKVPHGKGTDENNEHKRDVNAVVECLSFRDPDSDRVDTICCHEQSDIRKKLATKTAVQTGCFKSNSDLDCCQDGVIKQENVLDPCVSQHNSLPLHKCSFLVNQTADMSQFSDFEHDTAVSSILPQEPEEVSQPCVSQNNSSCCVDKHLPFFNQKSIDQSEPFRMILDSYMLDIQKVDGIYLQDDGKQQFEEDPDKFVQQISSSDGILVSGCRCPMQFTVKEHCLHVFMKNVHSAHQFPHAVQVWYQTQPSGPSLKWTRDQDDHQDFPTALPTWQASVTVDPGLTVLLTGDADPDVTVTNDGKKKFSYFTQFPMPASTFAIAVGNWEMETLQYESMLDDVVYQDMDKPQIHLFFPMRWKEKSCSVLGNYLPRCLLEVQRMLGRYPFRRLDVLIVPACFDSLGMASPSVLFLSQSILCSSMCIQVAHELCHSWFGLVIGPQDWTEEWMTEGFCTYLEDILHANVMQLGDATEDFLGLRAELHLRVLKAEMENTDENLQSLRPNRGTGDPQVSGEETRFLKNGMNVEKKFMQVHYLKGYFLLHALEKEVGKVQFLSFLKEYVQKYLYQLVTSQEFLQMFFSTFTDLTHISMESINAEWLDYPGMPKSLTDKADKGKDIDDKKNALFAQVQEQLVAIIRLCRRRQRKRHHDGQLHYDQQQLPELHQMQTPQVVVLLDHLLDKKQIQGHVLDLLRSSYHCHFDNAEVCHRWCELVIKHKHKKWFSDVEHFLIHHQAMGVYLYGEASLSHCPPLLHLVRSCFRQLQHDMPESVHDTILAMLYGK